MNNKKKSLIAFTYFIILVKLPSSYTPTYFNPQIMCP